MIRMRHQSSLNLSFASVHTTTQTDTWEVDSTESNVVYDVTLLYASCPYSCSTRCHECEICVHMFSCNCSDTLIKNSICKHVHLVARFRSSPETLANSPEHNVSTSQNEMDISEDVVSTLKKPEANDTTIVRNNVQTALLSLAGYIQSVEDVTVLKELKSQIFSAVNFIKASTSTPFLSTQNLPATAHIQKQRPFVSTKKKRKTNTRIRKPTTSEKRDISRALLLTQCLLYGPKRTDTPIPQNTLGKSPS